MAKPKYDKPTFFNVEANPNIEKMFGIYGYEKVGNLKDAAVVVFGGGPDVSPMLYGQSLNPTSSINFARDKRDIQALHATNDEQTLVGICRGAQFLNVMVGRGQLYQHVDNHAISGYHEALVTDYKFKENVKVQVNSTHHQMMIPGSTGDVLMRAMESTQFYGENPIKPVVHFKGLTDMYDVTGGADIEAVYYWDIKNCNGVLCYQPHPEFMNDPNNDGNTNNFFDLLERYCIPDKIVDQTLRPRAQRLHSFKAKREDNKRKEREKVGRVEENQAV